jgi:hypothetical protein
MKQIKRDGRQHFKSFWNSLQFVTLLTSVTCVIMYLLRHAMTSVAVDKIKKLKGLPPFTYFSNSQILIFKIKPLNILLYAF